MLLQFRKDPEATGKGDHHREIQSLASLSGEVLSTLTLF